MSEFVIAVHGGAGAWRLGVGREALEDVIRRALQKGAEVMRSGSCLEAVVEAIASLEDSGILNAGVGSTLDYLGRVSMDAGLMRSDGRAGAVALVTYPRNPIRLAKIVMERTPHVLIAGPEADELARRMGLERHPGPSERALAKWRELRERPESEWVRARIEAATALGYDTVGAVALGPDGCLAAGASTGGVSLKLPGRIGDSPVPGAGFYANENIAVSATGIGETILLSMSSLRLADAYLQVGELEEALERVVSDHSKRWGLNTLGLIAVTRRGEVGGRYNAEAMPWGYMKGGEIRVLGIPA
ncbi:MAG: isoaspartyl peptidase/L-asparaginase [Acidilobaceae archaeon]|nr:isoaspartyl peptidase/L-asparaginase [Acidilobaceae archaeon]MCX8165491.1 isoaspartyl peptidase/L-asparaginase [Acidilobaceae archaeon]MDW7973918.1 isoaspartyl peptidase/L-asparaginase [Sulfolobales archaeon]